MISRAAKLKTLVGLALIMNCVHGCFNYVCSDEFKTCTKKGGANVYVNSNACDSKFLLRISVFVKNRKLKITV